MLGVLQKWWAQVFALLALIAILDKAGGFKTDLGAAGNFVTGTVGALKV